MMLPPSLLVHSLSLSLRAFWICPSLAPLLLTHPTLGEPGRVVCWIQKQPGQSKRARVKEHRLSENTIGLVCRLREHKD